MKFLPNFLKNLSKPPIFKKFIWPMWPVLRIKVFRGRVPLIRFTNSQLHYSTTSKTNLSNNFSKVSLQICPGPADERKDILHVFKDATICQDFNKILSNLGGDFLVSQNNFEHVLKKHHFQLAVESLLNRQMNRVPWKLQYREILPIYHIIKWKDLAFMTVLLKSIWSLKTYAYPSS